MLTIARGCIAMENLESRVTDLEIQISHYIRTLEELNSVIIIQQKQIEKIEQLNHFLIENFKNPNSSEDHFSSDQITQKPPHY